MTAITGKTVLITGASRGIGAAAARRFAALGAQVVLLARSTEEITALAEEITRSGGQALAQRCDVAIYGDMEAAIRAAQKTFGRVDVLIGNAGVIEPIGPISAIDPEAWGRVIDINLKGIFHGMRAAMPAMQAQGGGTIITISSGAAHNPLEGWSHYCASKAGAAMLTRCADKEGRAQGIRAMGLSPGTVATDMQREIRASGVNPVSRLDWSEHIPPEWPAEALVWMCGPDAEEFAGQEVSLRDEAIRRRIGLVA
ncbi:short-chain dehydrogenase [Maritimibacter sp. 55A14]|uniref:SDR family oxidoreductase n=1 Tax=Maritimibacter sp. 55A14 TaxID=2174844 RepID=UPI000D603DA9|nr:SDR family oxidoreductase [Maritimibacter sp. 55A14]PWE32636.1 short-chain dehydrogenase [Maritimibacter sp. 55A14]